MAYAKAVNCPACEMQFSALVIQARKDQPAQRESDFHKVYRTPHNPTDYELWVCPNCLYSALPSDFAGLSDRQRGKVAQVVEQVVASMGGVPPEFNADRTLELRDRSLQLALGLYRMRQAPAQRLAAVLHRLAWCARERNEAEAERGWLEQALEQYTAAYRDSELDNPKEELRIQYLCGELSLRIGNRAAAVEWFASALKHPKLNDHPMWEKMLREQWSQAREQPNPV